MEADKGQKTEVVVANTELKDKEESIRGPYVMRLLNVVPVDLESLLKELDEEN